jgi:hypothetical protein
VNSYKNRQIATHLHPLSVGGYNRPSAVHRAWCATAGVQRAVRQSRGVSSLAAMDEFAAMESALDTALR